MLEMHGPFTIIQDDPQRPEVADLLKQHLADMARHTPPESMHALDVVGLSSEQITFWSVWAGTELAGCGALKQLDPTHGEIKSMHTSSRHLRTGVASSMLMHMIAEARRRGYVRLSLETGSMDAYELARSLYGRFGFEICGPFADYVFDPNSTFMTREL
jgi:putative acetyltransferase